MRATLAIDSVLLLLVAALSGWTGSAMAHAPGQAIPVVPAQQVPQVLRAQHAERGVEGAIDLRFGDIFEMPVGPRGLQPRADFLALDGLRVNMVGYMVTLSPSTADAFMFAPLPVQLAVHDEGLADDLPPSAIYVRLPRFSGDTGPAGPGIPQLQGLLRISGRIEIGPWADRVTGRVFPATLVLDPQPRRALMALARAAAGGEAPPAPVASTPMSAVGTSRVPGAGASEPR